MTDKAIHIVDDDSGHRAALSWLLKSADYTVHEHDNALDFLSSYQETYPCVLLFDIQMPGLNGVELLEVMKERKALAPIVMLTGYGDVPTAMKAIKLGALDFIEKPFAAETLQTTLDEALSVARKRFSAARHAEKRDGILSALTKRERQVFDALVLGKTNKMIANELGIAERTVEEHRAKVNKKTGATNVADLIALHA